MADTNSVRNKIVVLSKEGTAFAEKFLATVATKQAGSTWKEVKDRYHTQEYVLDTRYYTAVVEVVVLPLTSGWATLDFHPEIGEQTDALIFQFEPSNAKVTSEVSEGWINAFIEEYAPSVLIAATSGDIDGDAVDEVFREWCLTNQVELVDLSATTPKPDEEEDRRFVERVGFERIWEALISHTWENMNPKKEASRPPTNPITASASTQPPSAGSAADLPSPTDFQSPEVLRLIELLSLNSKAASAANNNVEEAKGPQGAAEQPYVPFADSDADNADHFDLAIQQFRDLRARAAQMPDVQRRNMAAQMAMAFMQLMGPEEDEEDDDPDF